MSMECLDNFVIYVAGKTTSWISLILFLALLYCHLLDVELRHTVDGLPKATLYSTLTGKTTPWTIPCLAILSPLGC